MIRVLGILLAGVVLSTGAALAWEVAPESANYQVSRTRIAELTIKPDGGDDNSVNIAYVRFVDDTTALCGRTHRDGPRVLEGRATTAWAFVGLFTGNTRPGPMYALLMAARAGNNEVTAVIDTRNCRVVQASL